MYKDYFILMDNQEDVDEVKDVLCLMFGKSGDTYIVNPTKRGKSCAIYFFGKIIFRIYSIEMTLKSQIVSNLEFEDLFYSDSLRDTLNYITKKLHENGIGFITINNEGGLVK